MNFSTENPFNGSIPDTVALPKTPLTNVLVQIRFPEVLSIAKAEFIADFQERIRTDYPLNHSDQSPIVELNGSVVSHGVIWRFLDASRQWRLSLATNFVALETRAYRNRSDFTQRTEAVVSALSEIINPGLITRVGVRYVDRIHGAQWTRLSLFVRPELLGVYIGNYSENIRQTFNEAISETDVGSMTTRWGLMPKNQTHEPNLMPPISTPSWFLDVDVYNEFVRPETFDVAEVKARVMKLATRAYGFFRWAVNDDFLRECGGDI